MGGSGVALGSGSGVSLAVGVGVSVEMTSVCVGVNLIVAVAFVVGGITSAVALLPGILQAERINTPITNI
jgi:hypothetical protein